MRLYDDAMHMRKGRTHEDYDVQMSFEVMEQASVFDVTNVFEYISRIEEPARDAIRLQEMPYMVPQFETIWLEYHIPLGLTSDIAKWHYESGVSDFGVLIQTGDVKRNPEAREYLDGHILPSLARGGKSLDGETRWFLAERQAWRHRGQFQFLQFTRYWFLDESGRILCNPESGETLNVVTPFRGAWKHHSEIIESDLVQHANRHNLLAPFFAISLANCKNVKTGDAPPSGTRQQRRLAARRGVKEAQFKTLIIEPMKQTLQTVGSIDQHGLKKALHICRGHFAHYSEDKPLFGKYSGQFWKAAHVRGSADAGTVYKDYKVKASKDAAGIQ